PPPPPIFLMMIRHYHLALIFWWVGFFFYVNVLLPAYVVRHLVVGAPNPLGIKINKYFGLQEKKKKPPGGLKKNDRVDFVFFSVL
ncbi:hypothetical protein ACVGXX_05990, partial [Enterobacter intestinihominis]